MKKPFNTKEKLQWEENVLLSMGLDDFEECIRDHFSQFQPLKFLVIRVKEALVFAKIIHEFYPDFLSKSKYKPADKEIVKRLE